MARQPGYSWIIQLIGPIRRTRSLMKSNHAYRLLACAAIAAALIPSPPVLSRAHAIAEDRVLRMADGSALRYGLQVPATLGDRPLPLIVGLHYGWGGGGSPPAYYGRDYMNLLLRPGFAALDAIIIAPDCPGRGWADPRSDAAVMELIERIREEFEVDPDRIVVTGFSLGGMGTWSFAGSHPDLVSAAVPIAGRPTDEIVSSWGEIPVFAIHGDRDDVVPIGPTRDAIAALSGRGVVAELTELPWFTHFQTPSYARPLTAVVPWLERIWSTGR